MAKSVTIKIRSSEEERDGWQALAEKAGVSLSEWLRCAAKLLAGKLTVAVPAEPPKTAQDESAAHQPAEKAERRTAAPKRRQDGRVLCKSGLYLCADCILKGGNRASCEECAKANNVRW